MQDYTDISFFVNLDPFDKKNSKTNGVLKLVQKPGMESTAVTSEVNSSIDVLHNIISFALSKEIKIPQWMSDFSSWAINIYDYRNTFEVKLLQLIPSNVIDIVTLISILESIAFESRCTIGSENKTFFEHYIDFLRISNSNLYFKYREWSNENIFGVFTIKSFEIANFIILQDDSTGNVYAVFDNLKIEGIAQGQKIVSRIVLNGANYIFTGGFVVLFDNKWMLRLPSYDNLNQVPNIFLDKEFFANKKISEYEVLYAYNNSESDIEEFNQYFRDLTYENALIDLIYEILSVDKNFVISSLNEIFSKKTGFKTRLKEFDTTICNLVNDPTKRVFIYNLFKFCRIAHPQNNSQKYAGIKGDSFEFLSTLFEQQISIIKPKKRNSKSSTKISHPLYRKEDPVKGYNLGIELLTKGEDLDFAISEITNGYIINEKLSDEMLGKWFCSVGIALKSFGEIELSTKYLEKSRKLGIDTSLLLKSFEDDQKTKVMKLIGRIKRFELISFNSLLKDKFISNKGIILAYKILEYIAKDEPQIEVNSKKKIEKSKRDIHKIFEKLNSIDKSNLEDNGKLIISVYRDIEMIFDLLVQASLISVDPNGIASLTALGKIYFYNKNITDLLEFLLFTIVRTAKFEDLFSELQNQIQKKILSKVQCNIYSILSFIYSNGSLQITLKELLSKVKALNTVSTRKKVSASETASNVLNSIPKSISKNSIEYVYSQSIFYFLELFGIIQQQDTDCGKTLRISDEGIYLMGNIELQIDKLIPFILRKIIITNT